MKAAGLTHGSQQTAVPARHQMPPVIAQQCSKASMGRHSRRQHAVHALPIQVSSTCSGWRVHSKGLQHRQQHSRWVKAVPSGAKTHAVLWHSVFRPLLSCLCALRQPLKWPH